MVRWSDWVSPPQTNHATELKLEQYIYGHAQGKTSKSPAGNIKRYWLNTPQHQLSKHHHMRCWRHGRPLIFASSGPSSCNTPCCMGHAPSGTTNRNLAKALVRADCKIASQTKQGPPNILGGPCSSIIVTRRVYTLSSILAIFARTNH